MSQEEQRKRKELGKTRIGPLGLPHFRNVEHETQSSILSENYLYERVKEDAVFTRKENWGYILCIAVGLQINFKWFTLALLCTELQCYSIVLAKWTNQFGTYTYTDGHFDIKALMQIQHCNGSEINGDFLSPFHITDMSV